MAKRNERLVKLLDSIATMQREADLQQLITEEKLKPEETRKFLENAFREGEVKTVGTDIDKLMPPVSRFGGGNRTQKKQTIIEKLKAFFEKYFGIGTAFTSEEHEPEIYELQRQEMAKAAEKPEGYEKK